MRCLIGTPAYNFSLTAEYHTSIVRLVQHFHQLRPAIEFDTKILGSALLALSRNVLAHHVLADPRFTHLLFVDADMGFKPDLIARMLDFDQPVAGCIYPGRSRRLDQVTAAAAGGAAPARALDAGVSYIGQPLLRDGEVEIRGDFMRAKEVGTGIMLIKREALERMAAAFPELATDKGAYSTLGAGPVVQMFEPFQGPEGVYYGEDVAFCRRWIERCGGEIWACLDAEIVHVGRDPVIANFGDRAEAAGAAGR